MGRHRVEEGEAFEVLDLRDEELRDGGGVREAVEGGRAELRARDGAHEDEPDVEEERVHHRAVDLERVHRDEKEAPGELDRAFHHRAQDIEGKYLAIAQVRHTMETVQNSHHEARAEARGWGVGVWGGGGIRRTPQCRRAGRRATAW